jgi:hypothetical protein
MERKLREELKALSTEFLGGPNRYRKLIAGVLVDSKEKTPNGASIKVVQYLSEEGALESLRKLKEEQQSQAAANKVQEEAGGSVNG